ncbi:5187_t:CDS:2 [Entrophospora sp. SA101]|nr:5187_t:CDS:2 [Entrophospora sp. SA101]
MNANDENRDGIIGPKNQYQQNFSNINDIKDDNDLSNNNDIIHNNYNNLPDSN